MRTSPTTMPSKPTGDDRVPEWVLGYFRTRNRHRAYSMVVDEFEKSGISQATLARRLGKGTDAICRWLSSPGNWTLDTVSDLMFATSGSEPAYMPIYPLGLAPTEEVDLSNDIEATDQATMGIGKRFDTYSTDHDERRAA